MPAHFRPTPELQKLIWAAWRETGQSTVGAHRKLKELGAVGLPKTPTTLGTWIKKNRGRQTTEPAAHADPSAARQTFERDAKLRQTDRAFELIKEILQDADVGSPESAVLALGEIRGVLAMLGVISLDDFPKRRAEMRS